MLPVVTVVVTGPSRQDVGALLAVETPFVGDDEVPGDVARSWGECEVRITTDDVPDAQCVVLAVRAGDRSDVPRGRPTGVATLLVQDNFEDDDFSDDGLEIVTDVIASVRLFGENDDATKLRDFLRTLVDAAVTMPVFASLPLDALLFDSTDITEEAPFLYIFGGGLRQN